MACEDDATGGLVDVGTRSSGKAIGSVPAAKRVSCSLNGRLSRGLVVFGLINTTAARWCGSDETVNATGGVWVKERLSRSCPPARAHAVNIRGLQCTRAKANALVVSQVCR